MRAAAEDGWTPLHLAASYGESDVAHLLLDEGARPDAGDEDGVAPIDLAAAPRDIYDRIAPEPDMDLLFRMIRGSGALVVLASKVAASRAKAKAKAADDERRKRGDAADAPASKRARA